MEVSPYQSWVGQLAERHPAFFLKLGNFESQWFHEQISSIRINKPVFVTGLARSGSTILLEMLARHPELGTHRYRDFPLLHIPIWWNWFLDRASGNLPTATERAHKDGIFVTADSPESMEEILWMAFFPRIHDSSISAMLDMRFQESPFEKFYCEHIRKLLMLRKAKRYLSKGNYNVSRLRYLLRLFPDARFVIPFREPVSHIGSLMKQHRLFCEVERQDPKVLAYMRRAGHFEFGLDRRPINFGNADVTGEIARCWAGGDEIRGWSLYWADVYRHVIECLESDPQLARQSILVHYDELCRQPRSVLSQIYRHCDLDVSGTQLDQQAAQIAAPSYYKNDFDDKTASLIRSLTSETYDRFRRHGRNTAVAQ